MNNWFDFTVLSHPANWVIIALVLIFVSYGGFVISQNAGILTPSLKIQSPSS